MSFVIRPKAETAGEEVKQLYGGRCTATGGGRVEAQGWMMDDMSAKQQRKELHKGIQRIRHMAKGKNVPLQPYMHSRRTQDGRRFHI